MVPVRAARACRSCPAGSRTIGSPARRDGGPMAEADIGVIGITAASSPLDEATEQVVETPYGATSAPIALGDVGGRRVAFLPRLGNAGEIPPHRIPYRANVWALRELGVRRIVAPVVCGALTLEYDLGDIVVCDQ